MGKDGRKCKFLEDLSMHGRRRCTYAAIHDSSFFFSELWKEFFGAIFAFSPSQLLPQKEEKIKAIIFRPPSPHEQVINMEAKKFDSRVLGIRRRREKKYPDTFYEKRRERYKI